jgi:hypothetical protein
MAKLRAFILIVGGIWAMGFIGVILTNLVGSTANLWELPASTWQIAVTTGVVGVFGYFGTVIFPVIIKPSTSMKFPEA